MSILVNHQFFLSIVTISISIASFATLIRVPVGLIGASCGLTFSITSGFVKNFSKTIRNKKKKSNKITMLARSKLNSIESKISEALINNEISHEDFMTILNKEKKYRELKHSKKIGINEVIKHNEIINNSLK